MSSDSSQSKKPKSSRVRLPRPQVEPDTTYRDAQRKKAACSATTPITDKTKRAFFGHHKCGSTWLTHVLLKVTGELGLSHVIARPSKFGMDFAEIGRGPA